MKMLTIYTARFACTPADKTLADEPDCTTGAEISAAVIGLIHAEANDDDEDPARVGKNLIKTLKWGAQKNETRRIVLHSFTHLAETKSSSDFIRELQNRAKERLENAGCQTWKTPFGYFRDLDLQAPGHSTARISTSFCKQF